MERAEKIGLGIATAGHVLLFGLLSLGLMRAPEPLKLDNPPMDVAIVDEVALRSTAPQVAPEAPPPAEAPELGPQQEAAPAPQLVSPPKPEPAPRPRPAAIAKPLPRLAAPVPVPSPPKKVPPAKPALAKAEAKPTAGTGSADATRGSRLKLDPSKWLATAGTGATPSAKPTAGTPAAAIGPAQKAALDAEIRRQLKPYWKSPTGADVEQLKTIVVVKLAKDGSLAGEPAVHQTTGQNDSNRTQVRLHQEQAIKAVKLAAPFKLPPDLYKGGWESLLISFDKRLSQ